MVKKNVLKNEDLLLYCIKNQFILYKNTDLSLSTATRSYIQ
ncbi:hypothetical protein XNC1_3249 [Xenorhabdus nematophila ATCC 19061]|uniref:Uncharacterized protein n=1 Tax=Xenorhabdus nematophila (strain ATCC 19061 / DSM 3370 / CCUG 14189 / LMG 1036 / NCIMB 9965 / AN6) TaxID=406817 RepID=D3VLH5_XENNA|nr:hypothetical protein XNC1_3249 [Xenorhabdus nematophila ATCC 19061]